MVAKISTVAIFKPDLEYIEDLQYLIRKNFKIVLRKQEVLRYILEYIKTRESDFFKFLKKSSSPKL